MTHEEVKALLGPEEGIIGGRTLRHFLPDVRVRYDRRSVAVNGIERLHDEVVEVMPSSARASFGLIAALFLPD
jgi:hypothetical protein